EEPERGACLRVGVAVLPDHRGGDAHEGAEHGPDGAEDPTRWVETWLVQCLEPTVESGSGEEGADKAGAFADENRDDRRLDQSGASSSLFHIFQPPRILNVGAAAVPRCACPARSLSCASPTHAAGHAWSGPSGDTLAATGCRAWPGGLSGGGSRGGVLRTTRPGGCGAGRTWPGRLRAGRIFRRGRLAGPDRLASGDPRGGPGSPSAGTARQPPAPAGGRRR